MQRNSADLTSNHFTRCLFTHRVGAGIIILKEEIDTKTPPRNLQPSWGCCRIVLTEMLTPFLYPSQTENVFASSLTKHDDVTKELSPNWWENRNANFCNWWYLHEKTAFTTIRCDCWVVRLVNLHLYKFKQSSAFRHSYHQNKSQMMSRRSISLNLQSFYAESCSATKRRL